VATPDPARPVNPEAIPDPALEAVPATLDPAPRLLAEGPDPAHPGWSAATPDLALAGSSAQSGESPLAAGCGSEARFPGAGRLEALPHREDAATPDQADPGLLGQSGELVTPDCRER
jgi:hypothetical protein